MAWRADDAHSQGFPCQGGPLLSLSQSVAPTPKVWVTGSLSALAAFQDCGGLRSRAFPQVPEDIGSGAPRCASLVVAARNQRK